MSDWAKQVVDARRQDQLSKRELHQAYVRNCVPIIRSLHESILRVLSGLPREIRWGVSYWDPSEDDFTKFELIYSAKFEKCNLARLGNTKTSEVFRLVLDEMEGSLDCVDQCQSVPKFTIATGYNSNRAVFVSGSYKCGSAPWPPTTGFELTTYEQKNKETSFLSRTLHQAHYCREKTTTRMKFSALSDKEIDGIVQAVMVTKPFRPTSLAFGTVHTEHKVEWSGKF